MSLKAHKSAVSLPLSFLTLALACRPQATNEPGDAVQTREVLASPATPAPVAAGGEAKGDEKKEEWSVENAPGEWKDAPIDTRSGTWMSVDVRPDGKEITFDLLGDIYTMPIGGGEAKALLSGVSWEMQPRYSPDGKWIAFTSDRGGGDNIWIVPSAGGEPTQITKEDFRLLNSPNWSPDGQYIIARKHFTKTRSLGAGEIWLYHVSGGKGVQLTEKPNDQKDVGEPIYSPDGRYIYYSQDDTPGEFFEYNKDPYAGIYRVKRVDLREDRTEVYLGGSGGAVRPTPSPDGKRIAFVRRVREKSVLFVHDIDTGAEWPVYDGLDRDMQETWAIHGVYPAFAWTPDAEDLVFWAGGKIHRVNAEGGATTEIPFHVADTRKVRKTLKHAQTVPDGDYDVKMLRWVQTSPDGKRAVFQALGYIWVRDLATGKTRRLTKQTDHYEFYPSFSRDGRSIVYVSWDDAELGHVRVASARGGKGKVLTDEPGHYLEPQLSPDGRTVVYRKSGGGRLRSGRYSREQGLYAKPVRGGKAERIARGGNSPHFAASSDRVFFMRYAGDSRVLSSVDLLGRNQVDHLDSTWATGFSVSPDGRWVAFQERYNVYVSAFPTTGKKRHISPDSKTMPTMKVSRDAGDFMHWSADASALSWSLGPDLYTRELSDAFAFLEGAPEKLPEPPTEGQNIGFRIQTDAPQGKVALVGGRIVTMKGEEVIEDGVVVLEGNRIAAVGKRGSVDIPADAKQLDVKGNTLIPGLVDVHAHGPQARQGITPETNYLHLAELAFGVTTVHDPSNDTHEIFAAAEMQRAGEAIAPRIFSTGTILYGATTDFTAKIDSLDDARGHLRRMKAVGAFSVKSYNQPRREQRQQVITAADELGMLVVPEGGSLYQHNMTMVVDGHTGLEHSLPVPAVYDDVVQLWSATDVQYTPTLVVAYGGRQGEDYWYQHTEVWDHPRLTTFVNRKSLDARARRPAHLSDDDWNHIDVAVGCKKLRDAGVRVNVGAHGQREGLAAHWEMWMLEQGGFTPFEALRAGTIDGATYLGLEGDIGSIEVGKLADIAVLDGDVLKNLRDSEKVVYTIINGRVYDASTMDQVLPQAEARRPLWWELEGKAP